MGAAMAIERCACGRPLHYARLYDQMLTERLIAATGPEVPVKLNNRTWLVQQHYLALHGPTNFEKMKFAELVEDGVYLPFLYDNGRVLLSTTAPDPTNQVFSHIDDEDGTERHFHIPKLQQLADQRLPGVELVEFEIIEPHVQFIITNRGIDEYHVNERLKNADLDQPGLMCSWPDGSQLVVDGNHRYVARFRRGKPFMAFWVFPERVWRRALLRWVPGLTGL